MSSFDISGVVAAALLGATFGLVALAPDMKPVLLLFVVCPPAFVVWVAGKIFVLRGPGAFWSLACVIVIANAALYGFVMSIWNSLPRRLSHFALSRRLVLPEEIRDRNGEAGK
jgi:hypothetical protein